MAETARLMAMVLIAEFTAAVFSLADTPREQRPVSCLYVDEVQNFATEDFRTIVTEARKYNLCLTVAHQYMGQLPGFLQDALKGVQTTVVYRVNSDDAPILAKIFPARPQEGGGTDFDPHPLKYLLEQGSHDSLVKTFIEVYLRPLQHHKRSGSVEIPRHIGVWDVLMPGGVGSDGKIEPIQERDPTLYLDNLLVEVMRTKNALLTIPYEAAAGFANCNGGFYKALRWSGDQDYSGNVQFPEYLANQTRQGYVWLRPPRDDRERFLHFIFHLRMVMMHFAAHPLVKGSKVAMVDYAQILNNLPKRYALVRSGEDVGLIVTNDTPKPLVGEALNARRFFIREHTHQYCCHPRGQIEQLIDDTTPPDEFTLDKWNIKRSEKVESEDEASSRS